MDGRPVDGRDGSPVEGRPVDGRPVEGRVDGRDEGRLIDGDRPMEGDRLI